MRKWQVLHIAIISNFKTLLKVSFEKCSKLTRADRLESPEGVSLGQKCSNMSVQRTLHVNMCNQYVIYLINQLNFHFLSNRPQLSIRSSPTTRVSAMEKFGLHFRDPSRPTMTQRIENAVESLNLRRSDTVLCWRDHRHKLFRIIQKCSHQLYLPAGFFYRTIQCQGRI